MQPKKAPPMNVLFFRAETTLKGLHQFSARSLYKEAIRLGLDVVGPVHWIYYGANADPEHLFQLEVVLPVDRTEGEPDGCQFNYYEPFEHLSTVHNGPWDTLGTAYPPLISKIHQAGYTLTGIFREVYLFWDMAHPEYNVTEVQIGIK